MLPDRVKPTNANATAPVSAPDLAMELSVDDVEFMVVERPPSRPPKLPRAARARHTAKWHWAVQLEQQLGQHWTQLRGSVLPGLRRVGEDVRNRAADFRWALELASVDGLRNAVGVASRARETPRHVDTQASPADLTARVSTTVHGWVKRGRGRVLVRRAAAETETRERTSDHVTQNHRPAGVVRSLSRRRPIEARKSLTKTMAAARHGAPARRKPSRARTAPLRQSTRKSLAPRGLAAR